MLGVYDTRESRGIVGHLRHVQKATDIAAAVANKYPDFGFFFGGELHSALSSATARTAVPDSLNRRLFNLQSP